MWAPHGSSLDNPLNIIKLGEIHICPMASGFSTSTVGLFYIKEDNSMMLLLCCTVLLVLGSKVIELLGQSARKNCK